VGRSKEVIIDSNGKNIYPDEIEDLYSTSAFIKELSVVGLPDGIGEKVACMAVPDYDHDIALARDEVRRKVEEHFKDVSSTLPFFKRVKVLHFSDDELPRTATRKVKRREVVRLMQALEQNLRSLAGAPEHVGETKGAQWLIDLVAQVANRPRAEVTLDSRLNDLGFDSLMYVELATAIEAAGGALKSPDTLTEVRDLRELASVIIRQPSRAEKEEARRTRAAVERKEDEEIHIPSVVRTVGNRGLDVLQRAFYEKILHTKIEGQTNIPAHTNCLVAANHSSHLDMGLVKMSLGEAGKDLVALAAADYFFDNKYKRAYMDNFTNLVPMERSGSLRKSLRHALSFLERGYNALIFPEGTRSLTGEMADFKPVIGFLALTARVGILPVCLHGTYEALPKGSNMLKSREVGARLGRFISIEELEELTKGMSKSEAYRLIAAYVRHQVENLRDGSRNHFDAQSLRQRWRAERRGAHAEAENTTSGEQFAATGD
ncbi:MAG: 1-acyl-sn-glycerol-3-phosphate acyltransferase, partial [Acidobacteriota bacterium]|nr:1-acyl-sn-glycerol-3-phosphate acyltransferase [Acidobacteriota bacterium]